MVDVEFLNTYLSMCCVVHLFGAMLMIHGVIVFLVACLWVLTHQFGPMYFCINLCVCLNVCVQLVVFVHGCSGVCIYGKRDRLVDLISYSVVEVFCLKERKK